MPGLTRSGGLVVLGVDEAAPVPLKRPRRGGALEEPPPPCFFYMAYTFGASQKEIVVLCAFQSWRRRVRCSLFALTLITASVLRLGIGLAQGNGETDNSISALLDKANAGDSHAQSELANDYLAGTGVPKDWSLAAKWLRAAAVQGDTSAMFGLGIIYRDGGPAFPANPVEAAKWFRMAAELGDAASQVSLADLYAKGEGVPQDPAKAATWYVTAAEHGNPIVQEDICGKFYKGDGVPKDYAEAAKWCRKAAEQGCEVAQFMMGHMYLFGEGVPKDESTSVEWYHKAAEQGYPLAQYALGLQLETGIGSPKDNVESYMWLNLASVTVPDSATERGKIEKRMTPTEIADGQRLTREWLAAHSKSSR